MQVDNTLLHLSLLDGIGTVTIHTISQRCGVKNIVDVYDYTSNDFIKCGVSQARSLLLVQGLQNRSLLEDELQRIEKHGISWVSFASDAYPQLLKHIEQPPIILYFQGQNLFNQEKSIAFVGARKADTYAQLALDLLLPPLVQDDWTIVSGGALGTDTFVHTKTIQRQGKTIVVLGSGLLHWYPVANYRLFHQVIAAGGMIVSSFPLQAKPISGNFPVRNRIISGLSLGTVVVQAAEKSGALITAEFAMQQGREVFAVPGSIHADIQVGCHRLIQQGAKLVTCSEDIAQEFGYILCKQSSSASDFEVDQSQDSILEILKQPASTEVLLSKLSFSLEELQDKLFELSLEGKVQQDFMGVWKRI